MRKAICYLILSSLLKIPQELTQGNVQGVFHSSLELPPNAIGVTFLYLSSYALNKQNKTLLHPGFFRTTELRGEPKGTSLSVNMLAASKYYLSLSEWVGEIDIFVLR